jgi:hypothetical protein
MATKLGVEGSGDHKKELDMLSQGDRMDIDEEAARMSVNQIIASKMDNL